MRPWLVAGLLTATLGCSGTKLPEITPQQIADGAACYAQVSTLVGTVQSQIQACVALSKSVKAAAQ